MARPKFQPTAAQQANVKAMAGYGIPQEDICRVITWRDARGADHAIDLKTLRKHFREELDTGLVTATSKVADTLFKKAIGGNVVAMIFWLKARAGWRDQHVEIGGSGTPVRFVIEGAHE